MEDKIIKKHLGYTIYACTMSTQDGEKDFFGVQSQANKDMCKVRGSGNSLFYTIDDAEERAEEQYNDKKETIEREERQKIEVLEALKKEQELDLELHDLIKGKTKLQAGKIKKTLMATLRYEGVTDTLKGHVEKLIDSDCMPIIDVIDVIKPMSRAVFNRSTNEEQARHDRKIIERGTKKVYKFQTGRHIVVNLGKIAYDYGIVLYNKKHNLS